MDWLLLSFFNYLDWCSNQLLSLSPPEMFALLSSFLFIDAPRYVFSKLALMVFDASKIVANAIYPESPEEIAGNELKQISYRPFVSVLCPGKNERETMPKTIQSLLDQNYPEMEILAIDDGSTDGTWDAISRLKFNPKVKLYRRQMAGGKSSAANMGLNLAVRGEIIVIVDSDSTYEPTAISEIVKPFIDPKVGAVSGNLRVRNWNKNFITRFQAVDYLHSISLGRRLTSAIDTLSICSGAFGAFRRSAVEAVGGWDVGPGEDGDLTIKIRKIGYLARFAPDAVCNTNVPETWLSWWKQRRRWNRGVVRYKMRKHFDMALPGSDSYSFRNMLIVADVFFFRIFLLYSFFIYFVWLAFIRPQYLPFVMFVSFVAYTLSSMVQLTVQMYYSDRPAEDMEIMFYALIMLPYRFAEKVCRLFSVTEEFLLRRSYADRYVPRRVGDATIHW